MNFLVIDPNIYIGFFYQIFKQLQADKMRLPKISLSNIKKYCFCFFLSTIRQAHNLAHCSQFMGNLTIQCCGVQIQPCALTVGQGALSRSVALCSVLYCNCKYLNYVYRGTFKAFLATKFWGNSCLDRGSLTTFSMSGFQAN